MKRFLSVPIVFALLIVSGCTAPAGPSPIHVEDESGLICSRQFSKSMVNAGGIEAQKVSVGIACDTSGIDYYIVRERPPEGWTISESKTLIETDDGAMWVNYSLYDTNGTIEPDGTILWVDYDPPPEYEIHEYIIEHNGTLGQFIFDGEALWGHPDKIGRVGGSDRITVYNSSY